MTITIDEHAGTIDLDGRRIDLYSPEGFSIVSGLWVRTGWNQKYSYTFSWLGVPVIQMPEDMIRFQEVVARLRPDVIVETGVAHGGSLIYSASLCKLLGKGRVVGIDIEIRPHNRARIEAHPLSGLISLVEGSSTAPEVVSKVKAAIRPGESVLVVLDSDHSYRHVMAELEAYAPLVTAGYYIIATDGVMKDLTGVPRGKPEWAHDNPTQAAADFAAKHPDFAVEEPQWPFNESALKDRITHWPGAYVKRLR